jgi:hypothetical protein
MLRRTFLKKYKMHTLISLTLHGRGLAIWSEQQLNIDRIFVSPLDGEN